MTKALSGIKVIELGQVLAVPVAGSLLADFGAEVIKVEPPGLGDKQRSIGYKFNDVSLWWCVENRNKKSITLNLHHPRGMELLKHLITLGDVLMENSRPGFMEELGLTEEVILGINPRIIYARVSGFGKTGPLSHRSAYAPIAEGFAGLTYITGYPDRAPVRVGMPVADFFAASYTAFGILTAIYHREMHNGKGQVIDVALYEAVFRAMGNIAPLYDKLGIIKEREGNRSAGSAFGGVFRTKDKRYFTLMILTEADLIRFFNAVGRTDLIESLVNKDAQGRPANLELLEDHLRKWALRRTRKQVLDILEEYKLPCGPIYNAEDIVNDEQFKARDMLHEVEVPGAGKVKICGVIPRLTETPGSIETPPPTLGQHNKEVYCGLLGLSEDELASLKSEGAL